MTFSTSKFVILVSILFTRLVFLSPVSWAIAMHMRCAIKAVTQFFICFTDEISRIKWNSFTLDQNMAAHKFWKKCTVLLSSLKFELKEVFQCGSVDRYTLIIGSLD